MATIDINGSPIDRIITTDDLHIIMPLDRLFITVNSGGEEIDVYYLDIPDLIKGLNKALELRA